jgi:hypothetical protein
MFGIANFSDARKGGDKLFKVLSELPVSLIVLLTLGSGGGATIEKIDIPVIQIGCLESDRLKDIAYSASNIFVLPTHLG